MFAISKAAKLLDVNPQTLRRWDRLGKITCVKTQGNQRRIPKEEIERLLGRSIEGFKESHKDKDPFQDKKQELTALKLDVEKEKAVKALAKLKGDDVKKAKERERLLADERKAEAEQRRQKWVNAWVEYGYKYLDPFDYLYWAQPDYEPPPLELKVKTRKAIIEAIRSVETTEDLDAIRLLVEGVVDEIRERFNEKTLYPQLKRGSIDSAILSLTFPMWVGSEVKAVIISKIRELLESKLTGKEEPDEAFTIAEELFDELIKTLNDGR